MKNKTFLTIIAAVLVMAGCTSQTRKSESEYTFVTYNVENMFDADSVAVFNDYKTLDADGNPQYTKEDVLTKIQHAVKVLKQYNDGEGPDVLAAEELESDFSRKPGEKHADPKAFLKKYQNTTLKQMLGPDFNAEIADLPSELLLLKGMADAGLTGYDLAIGYQYDENGRPEHVQKNVVYSRLPIDHSQTRRHVVENARPILEVWLQDGGRNLVVFANHWKSGAGSKDMEQFRLQNASVLRKRLDELNQTHPGIDYVLAGDFNSDYNQSYRYDYMGRTGINTVLNSTGDEQAVASGAKSLVFNLWYELPVDQRGSDAYRGHWGTLMQIMISSGMYDGRGFQYVDDSFKVGRYPGLNARENSGVPISWSSVGDGYGFSDHLPVSMKFRPAVEPITLQNPSHNDNEQWKPIEVKYSKPGDVPSANAIAADSLQSEKYYGRLYRVEATITKDYDAIVNGRQYLIYAPSFNPEKVLESYAGTKQTITFYGRLQKYRGNWEWVIEDRSYLEAEQPG